MTSHFHPTNKGFTLIELLVVISIIGLLSSIVLASLSSARAKAQNTQRVSTLYSLRNALELYAVSHNGSYPPTNGLWYGPYSCWGGSSGTTGDYIPGLDPTYISSPLPRDPQDPTPGSVSGSCNPFISYLYQSNSNGTDYKLMDYDNNSGSTCLGLISQYPSLAARGSGSPSTYGGCGIGYWTQAAAGW